MFSFKDIVHSSFIQLVITYDGIKLPSLFIYPAMPKYIMVAGQIIAAVVSLLIAGSLLVSGGLNAYFSAANHSGISAVIAPLIPLGLMVGALYYAFKASGSGIKL